MRVGEGFLSGVQGHVFLQARQDIPETGTCQGIINILASLLTGQHMVILQNIQMAGDGGHVAAGILVQLANATFTFHQHLHNHQPHRMSQCLEDARQRLQLLDGGSRGKR